MADVYDWSTTVADNDDADTTINWLEGQAPSTVNNSARAMMKRVKELINDLTFAGTVGGTADAITLTSAIGALASNKVIGFNAGSANTGAATLNVNGLGAKAIRKISGGTDIALVAGDIAAAGRYVLVYDTAANAAAGAWVLVAPTLDSLNAVGYGRAQTLTAGQQEQARTNISAALAGHLYGLTLANNGSDATNDIDIATGEAASEGTSPVMMVLASALTKRLDAAWAVGTNQGGLDTGAIANTTYHVWLIKRPDTGVVDVLFSASASSPTMPTDYTLKRRIGSILRESASIVAFVQDGDHFARSPVGSVSTTNPGTSAVTATLNVPTGIRVLAWIAAWLNNVTSSNVALYLSDLATIDAAPGSSNRISLAGPGASGTAEVAGDFYIRTNTSAQIRYRLGASGASDTVRLNSKGWLDTRGRF